MPCGRRSGPGPRLRLSAVLGQLVPRPCAAGPGGSIAGRVKIEPIPGCTLGAVVYGISLEGSDLDDPEAFRLIEAAFLEHALLMFPGQVGLTREAQDAFTRRFGRLDHRVNITNQRKDGSFLTEEQLKGAFRLTEGFHTDQSFLPLSLKVGTLYAEKVEMTWGGETEWADTRACYDALDEETKAKVEELVTYNSVQYATARRTGVFPKRATNGGGGLKNAEDKPMEIYHDKAYLRPLVKVHPETGRKCLYGIGYTSFAIPGMSRAESEEFLDGLAAFACQPPRTYKHTWRPGDLFVWDQRCVLHRAHRYDSAHEVRKLRGTRVTGSLESESCLPSREKDEGAEILAAELAHVRESKAWESAGSRVR